MTAAADQPTLVDRSAKLPPVRPGRPLVGSVQELLHDPAGVLADSYERLGPVFRLRVLWHTYTVIAGQAALDFMGQRLDEASLSRHDFFGAIEKEFGRADLTLAQSGTRHARLRPPLSLAFSRQAVSPFVPGMVEVVRQRVHGWEMASVRPAMSDLKRMAFEVYCFALFGDAAAMPYRDSLLVTEYGMNVGGQLLPRSVFRLPWYRAAHRRAFAALWEQVHARSEANAARPHGPGILDTLLRAPDSEGKTLTEDEVVTYSAYGIAAACAYVSRLTGFMLYEILKSPDLQARLRQETDEVFGRGLRDASDVRHLHLLHGVYQEALRRHAISPGMPFHAKQDFVFAGYRIHKGESVVISPVPLAFSACPFHRPQSFEPERFLGAESANLQGAFYPFGLAHRTCVATGFVKVMALVTVATLLHERRFTLHPSGYQLRQTVRPLPSPDRKFRFRITERAPRLTDKTTSRPPAETEVLASYPGWDQPEIIVALRDVSPRGFAPGEVILQEGAPADAFYLLTRGSVEVTQRRGDNVIHLAGLKDGDFFGELGLLQNAPRNATVTAGSAGAETLVLDRKRFQSIVTLSDMVASEIAGVARRRFAENSLRETVSQLGNETTEALLPEFTTRACRPGEILIREGDPAAHFFIVKTGHVRVIRQRDSAANTYSPELGPGEIFGETGLLTGAPRNATVVASEDTADPTVVWVTDREGFQQLLRAAAHRHGELGEALLTRMKQRHA